MPLPLLFIIPAVVISGATGAGKTVKGVMDTEQAKTITNDANAHVEMEKDAVNRSRQACGAALQRLGEEKIFVLDHSINEFITDFEKLKNVDFTDSVGLEELRKFHIDRNSFAELKELRNFALEAAGGAAAGLAGGALTALGAYGAASSLAAASTGTAIASLSGAAATNATLAFFGGGALSAGGLGMAGGVAVLGGIVAGPALLVMGLIAGAAADKKLDIAKENSAQADEIVEELKKAEIQCDLIRRRTYMFYSFMAALDTRFLPLIFKMEEVIKAEGVDYSKFSKESKKTVVQAASIAGSIKALLDTPILTEAGRLTKESEDIMAKFA